MPVPHVREITSPDEVRNAAWRADRLVALRRKAMRFEHNRSFILGTLTAYEHTHHGEVQRPSDVFQRQSDGSWQKAGKVETGSLALPFYGDRIHHDETDFAVVIDELGLGIELKEQLLLSHPLYLAPGHRDHYRNHQFREIVLPMVAQAAMSGELVEYHT